MELNFEKEPSIEKARSESAFNMIYPTSYKSDLDLDKYFVIGTQENHYLYFDDVSEFLWHDFFDHKTSQVKGIQCVCRVTDEKSIDDFLLRLKEDIKSSYHRIIKGE